MENKKIDEKYPDTTKIKELDFPETGIYVRVNRGSTVENILLEHLNKKELTEIIDKADNPIDWIYPIAEAFYNLKNQIAMEHTELYNEE